MTYISSTKYPGAVSAPSYPTFDPGTTLARRLNLLYREREQADGWCLLLWPLRFLPWFREWYRYWSACYDHANSSILVMNGSW